jgi:PAS domain S-box-containing protein
MKGTKTLAAPPKNIDPAAVLQRMSDGFLALDGAGHATFANPAARRLLGWQQADAGGRISSTPLLSEGSLFAQILTRAITEGVAVHGEAYDPLRALWLEIHVYPEKTGFSVYFRDVSGLKRAERALHESEVNLRRVEAATQTGTWRLDVPKNEVLWSDETYAIYGIPKGTPLTFEAFLATVQPDDKAAIDRSFHAGPQGGHYDIERRIVVGGEVRWVREQAELEFGPDGRLLSGAGTTLDITGRKRAERQLLESRAQLASVVESAMDAVIATDARQRILLFNAAAEAMFHYPAAEVIGQPLDMLIPERFRKPHAVHIRNFAATGVTSRAMARLGSLSGLRAGGEEFPIEASIAQAEVDGNQLFTVILRDITERKQAEERQRLLTAELDHRVKNVLANVSAVARLSSRGARSVADFAEALTGRLQAMAAVHNLLQQGRFEGAGLADLIGQVLAPFRTQAGNIRIEGEPIMVTSKATQSLALVVQELATNAVKYGALSVPSGQVSVGWWRTDPREKPAQIRLVWRESGGPPVEPSPAKGFGLGVIEDMAQHLGASVDCAFLPQGLEYTLEGPFGLPAPVRDRTTSTSWLPRLAGPRRVPPRRILIVEDEAAIALQLKSMVESQGHSVAGPAASPERALGLIREGGIDAALLDIRLGDSDSVRVAEYLLIHKIPFAFTSGLGPDMLPQPLRSLPRIDKPYRDEDVCRLIATLFGP